MWPWVLGSAALGGLQAYQQSGGDLGKTLAGATIAGGLGALVPGVGGLAEQEAVRFAGTRLAPLLSLGPATAERAAGISKLAGGLTKAGIGLGATALIPKVASALSGVPGQAAKATIGAGGAAGVPGLGSNQPGAFTPVPAIPSELQGANRPISTYDIYNPLGWSAAARAAELKEGDVQLENLKKIAPYEYQIMSQAKKDEMQRNLAAAQIRSNIDTQADAIRSSLRTSQQMGANAASQMGSALAAQYQYS